MVRVPDSPPDRSGPWQKKFDKVVSGLDYIWIFIYTNTMTSETTSSTMDLVDMATLERVAPIIRHAAHPLRLRILDFLLASGGPRPVVDIVRACGAPQAVVSQQLRILRELGLVRGKRAGSFVLYEVADASVRFLLHCIRGGSEGCA